MSDDARREQGVTPVLFMLSGSKTGLVSESTE